MPEYHNHDPGRSDILNDFGITIVRLTNEQIIDEIDYTVNQIEDIAEKLINKLN